MTCAIDIAVTEDAWRKVRGARNLIARAVEAARARVRRDGVREELSVVLCNDAEIRRLNRTWRDKDKATNVLSFPASAAHGAISHLGDIAVAHETVVREAAEEGKPVAAHLAHMIVHGYLHLIGYDHETTSEAENMESLERDILGSLGYSDPYAGADVVAPKPGPSRRSAR
jgi:probable rRNA maturation factor